MAAAGAGLRLLLTGGQGFVGSALRAVIQARHPDWQVEAPAGVELQGEGAVGWDVRDRVAVERALDELRPDVVVHLAAIAAVTASDKDPRLAWDVNLGGTMNLVFALADRFPETHFLYISSGEIYGASAATGLPVDEAALPQPANPYAASKAAADILVRQLVANGLRATVMRPFNHIGPGQSEVFAMPSFAAQIARIEAGRQPPVLHVGALGEERDFLDVRDVADAYVDAIEQRDGAAASEVFNICSGRSRRVGDLLDVLLAHARVPIEVRVDPARLRRSPIPKVVGDATKLRTRLGWEPRFDIEETLGTILDAQRERIAKD